MGALSKTRTSRCQSVFRANYRHCVSSLYLCRYDILVSARYEWFADLRLQFRPQMTAAYDICMRFSLSVVASTTDPDNDARNRATSSIWDTGYCNFPENPLNRRKGERSMRVTKFSSIRGRRKCEFLFLSFFFRKERFSNSIVQIDPLHF